MGAAAARDPALRAGGPMERVFQVSYPGVPQAVSQVRRDVAAVLAGVPAAEDVVWCLGEVATNAVVHSRSGRPGGSFAVAADVYPGALVAIVVTDQGGPWAKPAADTYPHGLAVVRHLATEVRIDGDDTGRSVWVILPWGQDPAPDQNDSAPSSVSERYPPGGGPSGRQQGGWPGGTSSPTSPANRTYGSMPNGTPAVLSRCANWWNAGMDTTSPKCGTGTSWPSTALDVMSRQ